MFHNALNALIEEKGITPYRVAKDLGIHQGTMGKYAKGNNVPEAKNLTKIAEYFNVSVDYLLGKTDKNIELTEGVEYAFFEGYKQLDDEDKAELNRAAQRMLELKRLRENQQ